MIVFFDVNTVWRRKFADALQRAASETLLCAPSSAATRDGAPGDTVIRVPRGWAGALAWLVMPLLARWVRRTAGRRPTAVVVTTPHYLPLARRVARHRPVFYYCSDDYRSYVGWNVRRMIRAEGALCRLATASIFVSEALRTRAVAEHGLDPQRTFVSPNATEPRFAAVTARPAAIAALPGPVFGVAGMFNSRIDFAYLVALVADPRVGSLALVGPIDPALDADPHLARLRADPRVHFFGAQPHDAMPQWMAAFDVAVIPYAETAFNHFCSPMRLYDHLAIGQPIMATQACDQVMARREVISGALTDMPTMIGTALDAAAKGRQSRLESWDDRVATLRAAPIAGFLFQS